LNGFAACSAEGFDLGEKKNVDSHQTCSECLGCWEEDETNKHGRWLRNFGRFVSFFYFFFHFVICLNAVFISF
jgi:hypothetical protein